MQDRGRDIAADKLEIIETLNRYCFAVDFLDFAALETVFAEDASATYVLEPLGLDDVSLTGRDAIIGWLSSVLGNLGKPGPKHAMTNHIVEVDGDSAKSRSYLNVSSGIYTVEYRRTTASWRANQFHMRNYKREWLEGSEVEFEVQVARRG